MTNTILTKQDVKNLLHFKSDTSLYILEQKDETFFSKIKIGLHSLGYRADEIHAWLESRRVHRDNQTHQS